MQYFSSSPESAPENEPIDRLHRDTVKRTKADMLLRNMEHERITKQECKERMWQRIEGTIKPRHATSILSSLQQILLPNEEQRHAMRAMIESRLNPIPQTGSLYGGFLKWVAAFVITGMILKITPLFFLAPPTEAFTAVTLHPTGEVALLEGKTWIEQTNVHTVEAGTHIRTQEGTATILYHEQGVIRLDEHTSIILHTTDSTLQTTRNQLPAITLLAGKLWYQGFIPPQLSGFIIDTKHGQVVIHQGSVSLQRKENSATVHVLNRNATIRKSGTQLDLIEEEMTVLQHGVALYSRPIAQSVYREEWYQENLEKDAVHRQEIALAQQERLRKQAGILPTSSLYPVKRIAEQVDSLLTFTEQSRLERQIHQAHTRLREAAVLVNDGLADPSVELTLQEYQTQVSQLTEDKNTTLTTLVKQSLAGVSADIASVSPAGSGYLLKKALLETGPIFGTEEQTRNALVIDLLDALETAITKQDTGTISTWKAIKEELANLKKDNGVSREVEKKLESLALVVQKLQKNGTLIDATVAADIAQYAPVQHTVLASPILDPKHVQSLLSGITDRILLNLTQQQSRINQLRYELLLLSQAYSPQEQLFILRRLQEETLPHTLETLVRQQLRDTRLKM